MNDLQKISDSLRNICVFLPDREKNLYQEYKSRWLNNKNINHIWEDIHVLFFSIYFPESLRAKLAELSKDNFNDYLDILSCVDTPYILHNILFVSEIDAKRKWDNLIAILKKSPVCQYEKNIFAVKLSSIIAPVVLNIIISILINNDDLLPKLEELIYTLKSREDGFYIVYHYLKYLISQEHKEKNFNIIINKLCSSYHKEAALQFAPDCEEIIIINGIQRNNLFCETGILSPSPIDNDLLNDYRTVLNFLLVNNINENILTRKLFNTYKLILSTDAKSFGTYDLTFHKKYSDIANLLIAQDNPLESWQEIINTLSGAKYRLMYADHSEQSLSLRDHIKFMCVVSLRMLDILCNGDDNNKENARKLWEIIWDESIDLLRKYACFDSKFLYDYISRLIYLYFIISPVDIAPLINFLHEVQSHPILILQAIHLLIINKIDFADEFKEEEKFFLADIIHKAETIAKLNDNYKYLNKIIKECRAIFNIF